MVSPLYIPNIIVQCFSNIFDLVPTHNETKVFKTRFNLFTVIHSGIPHSVLFSLTLHEILVMTKEIGFITSGLQPAVCKTYYLYCSLFQFLSVSSVAHSRLTLCNPMTAARQASLSITNSWSLPKLMSIESVTPSTHLILCHPLLLLPSIFPSIRVFSNESALCIRWPKYWSFSFNISPSNEHSRLISFRMD